MATRTKWGALALLAAVVWGTGTRGDDAKKVDGDLRKMQGTWVNAAEGGAELKWVFDGDILKSTVNGTEYTSKLEVDGKGDPHPTIDFTITDGPEDAKGKKAKGIYKLDGDKLCVCVGTPGQDTRPSDLKAVEDQAFLFDLKRDK